MIHEQHVFFSRRLFNLKRYSFELAFHFVGLQVNFLKSRIMHVEPRETVRIAADSVSNVQALTEILASSFRDILHQPLEKLLCFFVFVFVLFCYSL